MSKRCTDRMANSVDPDQTALWEQSDLSQNWLPACPKIRITMEERERKEK